MPNNQLNEITIEKKIVLHRNASSVYALLKNFESIPYILNFVESVTIFDQIHSRWILRVGKNEQLTTDTEIVLDQAAIKLEWHSTGNSDVLHQGQFRFFSKEHNTCELHFTFRIYFPPMYEKSELLNNDTLAFSIEKGLERFKLAVEANEFPYKYKRQSDISEMPPNSKPFPLD